MKSRIKEKKIVLTLKGLAKNYEVPTETGKFHRTGLPAVSWGVFLGGSEYDKYLIGLVRIISIIYRE